MPPDGETPVARSRDPRVTQEQSLVLLAEGLAPSLRQMAGEWVLTVPAHEADRAAWALEEHAREARSRRARRPAPPPVPWRGRGPFTLALATGGALLAFHRWTGPWRSDAPWFAVGAADGDALREGELWRAVTALTLHADAAHVFGNALAGGLMLTVLGASLGPGVALLATVLAGTTGNVANGLLRAAPHVSVGASTAVFGAVGLLGGVAATRRRLGLGRRPAWVSVAATLGILAMLGTSGERTDVWAHAFGLAAGGGLGAVLGRILRRPPPLAAQVACGVAAAATVVASWGVALSARG